MLRPDACLAKLAAVMYPHAGTSRPSEAGWSDPRILRGSAVDASMGEGRDRRGAPSPRAGARQVISPQVARTTRGASIAGRLSIDRYTAHHLPSAPSSGAASGANASEAWMIPIRS